jgi:hypothetical protein
MVGLVQMLGILALLRDRAYDPSSFRTSVEFANIAPHRAEDYAENVEVERHFGSQGCFGNTANVSTSWYWMGAASSPQTALVNHRAYYMLPGTVLKMWAPSTGGGLGNRGSVHPELAPGPAPADTLSRSPAVSSK